MFFYKGYTQVILLFLIVCASACQPVPRPFQPLDKSLHLDRSAMDRNFSLSLRGIEGAGYDLEQRILGGLRGELSKLNILASQSSAGRGNFLLHGKLVISDDNWGHIYWRILDRSGDTVAMFEQTGFFNGEQINWLAQNTASRIQSLLSNRPEKPVEVVVYVPPINGAPGDGRISLTEAMRNSLGALEITVITELRADAASLLGSVVITKQDEKQLVEIHWSLIGDDGQEFALVTQSDLVPAGILDGAWGELADVIAEAASQSVALLIRNYDRHIEGNP